MGLYSRFTSYSSYIYIVFILFTYWPFWRLDFSPNFQGWLSRTFCKLVVSITEQIHPITGERGSFPISRYPVSAKKYGWLMIDFDIVHCLINLSSLSLQFKTENRKTGKKQMPCVIGPKEKWKFASYLYKRVGVSVCPSVGRSVTRLFY